MAKMPPQTPGQSKQDYQTPNEFMHAARKRLHIPYFGWDLAASKDNAQAEKYFTEAQNSLAQSWSSLYYNAAMPEWLWLNPPYANIKPWVEKAAIESANGAHIAMLIPASVGANWWSDYVEHNSYQLFLNGRITFMGCTTPYPKDCALLLYTPFIRSGNAVWTWPDYV
jgi:DNA (cytosine-5)-methyltransferase 1